MADFLEHQIVPGERWDTIAHKYYGDATKMHHLLRANPDLVREGPPELIFSKSGTLRIPVLQEEMTPDIPLPPWKKS